MSSQDDATAPMLGAIATILGPDLPVHYHPGSGPPRVVLFGCYSGGKTSVIRRLLTEDGTPVPSWLVVGPQPTTFEPGQIASGGLVYVDTPGMAGRSARHEQHALDTLGSADLVLAVIPAHPGSDDLAQLAALADRGFTAETTLIVMTRYEDLGDPEYGREDFLAALEGRRQALRALLPGPLAEAEIRAAAADPYGLLGERPPSGPSYYAPYRSWDGVAELRAWLAGLPGRLPRLRSAAARRYWLATVARARAAADEERAAAEAVITEAEGRRRRAALLRQRLVEVEAAAAGALHTAIGCEVAAVVRSAASLDSEELKTAAEDRLRTALTGWEYTWNGRLAELAREAEQDLLMEQILPSAVSFDAWTAQFLANSDQTSSASPLPAGILQRFTDPLGKIGGSGLELWSRGTGVESKLKEADSLVGARDLVKGLHRKFLGQHAKLNDIYKILGHVPAETLDENCVRTVQHYDSGLGRTLDSFLADSPFFQSFRQAERAKRWLSNLDIKAELVAPAMSLIGLTADVLSEKRTERGDRARRAREQQQTAEITARFAAQILGDEDFPVPGTWRTGVVRLRNFLADDPLLESAVDQASSRIAALDEAVRNL